MSVEKMDMVPIENPKANVQGGVGAIWESRNTDIWHGAKCCACLRKLSHKHFVLYLNKIATWENPIYQVWATVTDQAWNLQVVAMSQPRAFSVLCDTCYSMGNTILYAIEETVDMGGEFKIVYRRVDSLVTKPQVHSSRLSLEARAFLEVEKARSTPRDEATKIVRLVE